MTNHFINSEELSDAELYLVAGGRKSAEQSAVTFATAETLGSRPGTNGSSMSQIPSPNRTVFVKR
jgi:hypothetical protein